MPDDCTWLDVPILQKHNNTDLDGGRGRLANFGIVNIRLRWWFGKFIYPL